MMKFDSEEIDWSVFTQTRSALASNFVRILGYFREDGTRSVAQIESAMRANDAAAMVLPAHTLKGEASQFGAVQLTDAAERIEVAARHCVETRETPEEILEVIVALRPIFEQTIAALDSQSSPLAVRSPAGFGLRVA